MTTPRYMLNAMALYDARRNMGTPEGRALYATASGLAQVLDIPREEARGLIAGALRDRANVGTRTDIGAF